MSKLGVKTPEIATTIKRKVKCIYSTPIQTRRERSAANYSPSSIPYFPLGQFSLGNFLLPGNLPLLKSFSLSRDIEQQQAKCCFIAYDRTNFQRN